MKKCISVLMSLVLLLSMIPAVTFPARAATSGTCGENLTWTLDDEGTLTISGFGDMMDYGNGSTPWYDCCDSIKTVVIKSGITSISDYAFIYCSELTSVIMPESLNRIGEFAFYSCTGLTSIAIPDSVTSIGNSTFAYCTSLTDIAISEGLTSIDDWSFGGCVDLASVTIPEGVTNIGQYAFNECSSLTSVSIPLSVTDIGFKAFDGCNSLTDVYYSSTETQWSLISIREGNDPLLNAMVEVPDVVNNMCGDSLTWILDAEGTLTISGMGKMHDYYYDAPWYSVRESIKMLVIEKGATTIGECAFADCINLKDVSIADSVTVIGAAAFNNCDSIIEFTIPDGVKTIGNSAFAGSDGLRELNIPNSVTSLDGSVCNSCLGLKKVVIGDGVERLPGHDFIGCVQLTEIIIGKKVNYIGFSAFAGCANLSRITFLGNAPSKGEAAFYGLTAIAYYPGGNATWTADVMVSFGGNITWEEHPVASGTCGGNLTWVLNSAGALSISGAGDMSVFYYASSVPWADFKESIKKVVIQDGVTSIGDWAFSGCTALTEVTIPEGVTSVGFYAFSCCNSLTDITLPSTVTSLGTESFVECTGLTEMIIPDGVKWIGGYVFEGCTGLTRVVLPVSITEMGANVFNDCTALTDVYYKGTKEQWAAISMGANQKLNQVTIHYNGMQDIQTALDNAKAGAIITLTQDAVAKYTTVPSNVTLDLNGYRLTADYFTSYGAVVDGTDGGNALVIAKKGIHLATENEFMPIYDTAAGGYRFYKYQLQNLGFKTVDSGTVKAGFRLTFSNTAGYEVLSTTTDAALDTVALISWTGAVAVTHYTFSDDTLRNYAALAATDIAGKGSTSKALTLTMTGVDSLGADPTVNFQPTVETNTGMTAKAPEANWTAQ